MHAQCNKADSVIKQIKTNSNYIKQIKYFNDQIELENNPEIWLKYNDEMIQICSDQIKNSVNIKDAIIYLSFLGKAYNNTGFYSKQIGRYKYALQLHQKALKILHLANDKLNLAITYNEIGMAYDYLGNYSAAIENLTLALKLRDEIKDVRGEAESLNNIAHLQYSQGEFQMALKNYKLCYEKMFLLKDSLGIAIVSNNIGEIYEKMNHNELALNQYQKSAKLLMTPGFEYYFATSIQNISRIYLMQKNFVKAKENASLSLKLRTDINDLAGKANSLECLAAAELGLGKIKQALKLSEESYAIAKTIHRIDYLRNTCESMAEIHSRLGNYKDALRFKQDYILYRDSLSNEHVKKASIISQFKYDYEKKAAADSVKAAEEKKVVAAQLKQEKTQRFALYGGLGLVGLFALFMVNRFRVTNQQKKLIEEQKQIVEAQKHLVEEKQKEILDSIKYAKRIQTALITSELYFNRKLNNLKN
jgi:tetratricopeptide (TPR) repeat protein